MDGLVSTGNKFPTTILKIISFNQKIFCNYFIHILKRAVDKPMYKTDSLNNDFIIYKYCYKKIIAAHNFSIV